MIKARVQYHCHPKSKNATCVAEDIHLLIEFDPMKDPIPQIGQSIKLTKDGDFLCVDDVYFDYTASDAKLLIFVKDHNPGWPIPSWKEMKAQGWKLG